MLWRGVFAEKLVIGRKIQHDRSPLDAEASQPNVTLTYVDRPPAAMRHFTGRLIFVLGASMALIGPAVAETIAGQASVIDGDTLEIRGERIRLLDVDAPESKQTCVRPDGTEWRCGQQVALKLSGWIGERVVRCDVDRKDPSGQWLGHCQAGGEDIARWLVSRGWAVPYRACKCEAVREASSLAEAIDAGIWSGSFEMPWDWRKAN